ncbi:conserved hypothetical protein; putative membrane protein [Cupriavidus taiwanensis]|uniref:Uncharacterized protein n=1 Tax=Cupriavidus taiwanensis TaxID=164546 RepID=A0A976AW53_9BURK|nr:hypothetical protein [Cupriavidus taiwanensis]SOZ13736.1 conserved hypothetical protein; putative membrane protein [Cupriavidus taiwanensis]SOZ23973.1 conserved hypothetical protein; putative membrane protein [Cupriavidus taiwanensis]SOZ44346.1 conserved hypothetical protein; putative membrane protein [Cupriavidus taiwanensis]SOZ54733.1 conserved hypothetical protein; putative membrane protein [Cupriavidus taiwanensis]SOZ55701.1 conserved hypothetical protein; putative membrane protein [Cup
MRTLDFTAAPLRRAAAAAADTVAAPPRLATATAAPLPLDGQLRRECEAMASHALRLGIAMPAGWTMLIDSAHEAAAAPSASSQPQAGTGLAAQQLAQLHQELARAIAPATPQCITLLDDERRRAHPLACLGPVPLVRALTGTAVCCLLAVVLTGLPAEVSMDNMRAGILASSGRTLLFNMLFLLFCAGLGASFASLFQVHGYIAKGTYDPKYDAAYAAQLILGVMSGLILVEMLPPQLFDSAGMRSFGKPALSMLGGFSATAVHRLLQRIVEIVETAVRGSAPREPRKE